MAGILDRIPELIEAGEKLDFNNFAHMSPRGFPSAFREDYLIWEHEVAAVLKEIDSPT